MRTSLLILTSLLACTGCKKEPAASAQSAVAKHEKPDLTRTISLEVTDEGFVPAQVKVEAGKPVKLVVTRQTDETCAKELLIEGTTIKAALPLKTPVDIVWTPSKPGQVKFGCAMDMMISGLLIVE
jgi:plastocyanin domain-containing protein